MPAIFDALPGIEVPVGEITKQLAAMWHDAWASGAPAPAVDDAKATQVNFVLHFGLNTTPDDAAEQFRTVVRFSRRYPSRIVVLCPLVADDGTSREMRAKIYGECHLGRSKSDRRCVEFVVLSYPRAARPFLEDEVSICLSTDLPMYYWAHRFSDTSRVGDYQRLFGRAKRVLIDSAVAAPDVLTYAWPRPDTLRDIAHARLLPVRQTVGQFLAAYSPATLIGDLRGVTVRHDAQRAAEARVLLAWLQRRLRMCGAGPDVVANMAALASGEGSLAVTFDYGSAGRYFRWSGDLGSGHALFEANFGTGETTLAAGMSLLAPEDALSEAMFF